MTAGYYVTAENGWIFRIDDDDGNYTYVRLNTDDCRLPIVTSRFRGGAGHVINGVTSRVRF